MGQPQPSLETMAPLKTLLSTIVFGRMINSGPVKTAIVSQKATSILTNASSITWYVAANLSYSLLTLAW